MVVDGRIQKVSSKYHTFTPMRKMFCMLFASRELHVTYIDSGFGFGLALGDNGTMLSSLALRPLVLGGACVSFGGWLSFTEMRRNQFVFFFAIPFFGFDSADKGTQHGFHKLRVVVAI